VHGKKLYVVENEIFGFLFGIEILIQHNEIVGVVVQLAQGERGPKGMDHPEVEFLKRLRDGPPAFYIRVAQKSGANTFIDDIDCICVIQEGILRGLFRKATGAVPGGDGRCSFGDLQGGFAPWAKNLERLVARYFIVRNIEFGPASFALNFHCLSP
jgi:hypothetical protein